MVQNIVVWNIAARPTFRHVIIFRNQWSKMGLHLFPFFRVWGSLLARNRNHILSFRRCQNGEASVFHPCWSQVRPLLLSKISAESLQTTTEPSCSRVTNKNLKIIPAFIVNLLNSTRFFSWIESKLEKLECRMGNLQFVCGLLTFYFIDFQSWKWSKILENSGFSNLHSRSSASTSQRLIWKSIGKQVCIPTLMGKF